MKAKYNKSEIMIRAWLIFRSNTENLTFGQSLSQSWGIAKNGSKRNDVTAIYNKYYQQVYFYVLGRVFGKIELAQDLTNDTFCKVNEKIHLYDVKKAKMNTWLITIANRVIIDYGRSKESKQDRFTKIGDYVDSEGNEYFEVADSRESDIVDNNELSEILNKSIQNLKSNYREIATMFFLNQYSHEEISVLLDKPVGTVKGMIARSRAMIKESVNNMYA